MGRLQKQQRGIHRVVVVGEGVAAIRASSLLAKDRSLEVTLVHQSNFFEFSTSVSRTLAGFSRRHISLPIRRSIPRSRRRRVSFVKATVGRIDPTASQIVTKDGRTYGYDSLVFALRSSSHRMPATDSAELYDGYESAQLNLFRKRMRDAFANSVPPKQIAIVGAGQEGASIAAEVRQFINLLARKNRKNPKDTSIILIEKNKNIVDPKNAQVSAICKKRLEKKGIKVLPQVEAVSINQDGVQVSGKKIVLSDVTILTSGTKTNPFYSANSQFFSITPAGQVRCSSLFEAEGYNDVYVLSNDSRTNSERDIAEAMYDANYVVDVIRSKRQSRNLPRYEPPSEWYGVAIGLWWGVFVGKKIKKGLIGISLIRWIQFKHFATLLPIYHALNIAAFGSRHEP